VETTVARKRLEVMLDELDRSIAILQGERAVPDGPQDSADAGTSLSEADRAEALLSSARAQRDQALAALARIDEGRYGQCLDCGQQIPEERLDARPDAERCVSCQAKHARRRR
jgi:DnaK suppressor protein